MRLLLTTALVFLLAATTASATTVPTVRGQACPAVKTFKTVPLASNGTYGVSLYVGTHQLFGTAQNIHVTFWSGHGVLARLTSRAETAPATLMIVSTGPRCVGFRLTLTPS